MDLRRLKPDLLRMNKPALVRILLATAGTASVALGLIGVFVPVLPTTPFMLLAAACYARSSPRCHHWLLHNRWFGEYIRNYREGRGIPRWQKILTITVLWLTIGSTVALGAIAWWVRPLLVAIAAAVTVHLLRAKTLKPAGADPVAARSPEPEGA